VRATTATIHIVEPGGWGGIYQHAAALAGVLAEAGAAVVLHTAADAEDVPLPDGVARRSCFWRLPAVRPRALRRLAVATAWLGAGVPRCLAHARSGDIVHVEGRLFPVLLVPLVVGARLRRCSVGFSPHTTFSRRPARSAGPADEPLVRWLARYADVVFAFSDRDRAVMEGWGARPTRVPLVIGDWALRPEPRLVDGWRRRWHSTTGPGRPVVLFAGQVRPDKGLDLAVAAAARWRDAVLAVVGEDLGALADAVDEAKRQGVELVVDEGYQPLPELVAAAAAADVVICPYSAAGTSGVLALASALGRPTVATDVGGSSELATVTVPPGDPDALAAAVDKVLWGDPCPPSPPRPVDGARTYLAAYGLTPSA
jgi:glycosyltransferase involved in cell wall biosynthesis